MHVLLGDIDVVQQSRDTSNTHVDYMNVCVFVCVREREWKRESCRVYDRTRERASGCASERVRTEKREKKGGMR